MLLLQGLGEHVVHLVVAELLLEVGSVGLLLFIHDVPDFFNKSFGRLQSLLQLVHLYIVSAVVVTLLAHGL